MYTLIGLLAAVYLSGAVPVPKFSLETSGGVFTSEDSPGIQQLGFIYKINDDKDEHVGVAVKSDGTWRFTDPNLQSVKKVHFYTYVQFGIGDIVESPSQEWNFAPLATLPPRRMRGAVSFRDDFNGDKLDLNNWFVQVTAAGEWHTEFQVYTNDQRNLYVKNGHLYIKPTLTADSGHYSAKDLYSGILDVKNSWGVCTDAGFRGCLRDAKDGLLPPILSARIDSKPTLKYGQVTVRAQIPRGDWIWPAIWMMPRKNNYGLWPRSGEIDFMEAACNEHAVWNNGQKVGIQRVQSTLHFGPDLEHDHPVPNWKYKATGDWHGFHDYKLDWSPDHIILYVDGDVVTRMDIPDGSTVWDHYNLKGNNPWTHGTKIAPFDHEFYMILNVAVGGIYSMFGDYDTQYAYPKPWHNTDKDPLKNFWEARHNWLPTWHGDDVAMIVDYVEFRHM
ncbi:hypothetical protein SNE40_021019 [Patella caerulea]|uniref:GH16 domain-containing protein n=2 Tax=Patella caerulea TaxID=87958 RepID=A0AAN8IZV1_PATCE